MNVSLHEWRPGDEEAAVRWSRDQAFCLLNGWTPDLPAEQVREWWRQRGTQAQALRMIEMDRQIVGYAEWQGIQAGVAELGIALGDSRVWGKGVGAAAGRLMLEWAFGSLDFHMVWAEVHEPNARSLALMKKLAFSEIGRKGIEEYQGQMVPMVQFELSRRTFLNGFRPLTNVDDLV
ncbi:GNAT family N-acetyltransferase (plasmid) [Deinococcus radiomollis]|uniref:GNAT family N-acetyltransferase n=1 Tax=Deinococcus radiomollis TaxID=468916 RepID=UPI00389229A5